MQTTTNRWRLLLTHMSCSWVPERGVCTCTHSRDVYSGWPRSRRSHTSHSRKGFWLEIHQIHQRRNTFQPSNLSVDFLTFLTPFATVGFQTEAFKFSTRLHLARASVEAGVWITNIWRRRDKTQVQTLGGETARGAKTRGTYWCPGGQTTNHPGRKWASEHPCCTPHNSHLPRTASKK